MTNISDKYLCCGCSACMQVCPKLCITMKEDEKGFLYPNINPDICIDCGLCEKVCPYLNIEVYEPLKVFAAVNPNDAVRMQSSSGGVFSLLAETVINDSGVVVGARFDDDWTVKHNYTETIEDLVSFRGSKYVQSIIGNFYKKTKSFLDEGRKVLFSGTGCQIAGLKLFLRQEYKNLLTVEIACHGVPSPLVWREYVKKVSGNKQLSNICFRDKRKGWNGYGLSFMGADGKELMYEPASKNDFMQCFLNDLCLRPSCSNCPAKAGASGADIMIGDFWGIDSMHPEMHDDKGCSLVIAYSDKGQNSLKQLNLKTLDTTFEEACRYNPCILQSSHENRYAPIFWYNFKKHGIEAAPQTLKILRSHRVVRILAFIYYKYIKRL